MEQRQNGASARYSHIFYRQMFASFKILIDFPKIPNTRIGEYTRTTRTCHQTVLVIIHR